MESGSFENYGTLLHFAWLTWWLWLPAVLFYAAWELWKAYLKIWYWKTLEWVLLEIRIPRETAKPPQAMEQIFAGLHAIARPLDPDEKYWEGLQRDYLVFEFVGHGGELHFFVNTPKKFRNMVEAQIYAQYPDSEIREADDPARYLPDQIPNAEWTLFGAEWKLAKENPYPIRTYREFVLEEGTKEEVKVDPLSAVAEILSKLKLDEHIGIQLMIRPVLDDGWKKEGEKIVQKLVGKKVSKRAGTFERIVGELSEVMMGPTEVLKKEEKVPETLMLHLTPGEKDVVAGIENKIAKLGWEAVIRFVYVARRDLFDMVHFASVMGAMRQFNTLNLNGFKLNSAALVGSKWYSFIKKMTKEHKRRAFYRYYRSRYPFSDIYIMKSKPIILNTEELATIYHFPGVTVGAPSMPRLQARRAEPPAGLPVG